MTEKQYVQTMKYDAAVKTQDASLHVLLNNDYQDTSWGKKKRVQNSEWYAMIYVIKIYLHTHIYTVNALQVLERSVKLF